MTTPAATRSRAAFRHTAFRLYWAAQVVSLMGTFMQGVALGYLVYELTDSKVLLGVISALQMGPSLLLSLPSGVLADRVYRKGLVQCTQSTALVLAFTLASLTALHQLQVWEILLISTISGIAIAVESPARQALLVDLVGREDLPNAIAWNSLAVSGARVLGPAAGGIAAEALGVAPIFYYNSVSFLAVILVLAAVHIPRVQQVSRRDDPLRSLTQGLRYIRHVPAIALVLALTAIMATFAMNFNVLMPIIARDALHTDAAGLGWMWSAMGIGAVLGSGTVVRWSDAAVAGPLLIGAALMTGIAETLMAIPSAMAPVLAALVIVGWSTGVFFAGANSAIQHRVSDEVRGRVLSVYSMIFAGSTPLGSLLAAGLARAGSVHLSLAVCGGVSFIAALFMVRKFLPQLPGLSASEERVEVEQSAG